MKTLRRGPANNKGAKGFTLVELTMVVLLISLAVSIVVPQLADIGDVRAKAAMRRLQGTVRYLFNESIFKKSAYQLHIDIGKGEYWVELPPQGGGASERVRAENAFINKRAEFPPGIKIVDVQSPRLGRRSDGEVVVQFFPNGYVEPATIHVEDQHKKRFTFFIQPLSGKLKILDGYVEVTRRL